MCKMAVLSKIKPYSDAIDYFKELPFYNKPIKTPKVRRFKNIDRLVELTFYEQLSVIKTNQAFRGQAMSIVQLEDQSLASNCTIKIQLYN